MTALRTMDPDEYSPDLRKALRDLVSVLRYEAGTDEYGAQITIEKFRSEEITFDVKVLSFQ